MSWEYIKTQRRIIYCAFKSTKIKHKNWIYKYVNIISIINYNDVNGTPFIVAPVHVCGGQIILISNTSNISAPKTTPFSDKVIVKPAHESIALQFKFNDTNLPGFNKSILSDASLHAFNPEHETISNDISLSDSISIIEFKHASWPPQLYWET